MASAKPAKPAQVDHEKLLQATLALRGAVEGDSFRICSKGKRSFLQASSRNLRIVSQIPIKGAAFDLQLPYAAFQKLCKLFRSEVSLWQEGERIVLEEGGRRVFLLAKDSPSDSYPEWSEPKDFLQTDGKEFRTRLSHALRAASTDPGRPVLGTVALAEHEGEVSVVATDSFRLLSLPLPGQVHASLPRPLLFPRDIARSLVADMQRSKPEEVAVEYGQEDGFWGATVAYGSISWHFVSPEGQYPDWQDLLQAGGASLEVSREEIDGLLQFVEALAGKGKPEQNGASALRFELGDKVEVHFQRPGLGEITQTLHRAKWRGETQTLGVNPLFLQDMLDVLEGEKLQGQWSKSSGGIVFEGRGAERYLLMPVRLAPLAQ